MVVSKLGRPRPHHTAGGSSAPAIWTRVGATIFMPDPADRTPIWACPPAPRHAPVLRQNRGRFAGRASIGLPTGPSRLVGGCASCQRPCGKTRFSLERKGGQREGEGRMAPVGGDESRPGCWTRLPAVRGDERPGSEQGLMKDRVYGFDAEHLTRPIPAFRFTVFACSVGLGGAERTDPLAGLASPAASASPPADASPPGDQAPGVRSQPFAALRLVRRGRVPIAPVLRQNGDGRGAHPAP